MRRIMVLGSDFSSKRISIRHKYYVDVRKDGKLKARTRWSSKREENKQRIEQRLRLRLKAKAFVIRINGMIPIKRTSTDFYFDIYFPKFVSTAKMQDIEAKYKSQFNDLIRELELKVKKEYPPQNLTFNLEMSEVGIESETDAEYREQSTDSYVFTIYFWDEQEYYSHRGEMTHDT